MFGFRARVKVRGMVRGMVRIICPTSGYWTFKLEEWSLFKIEMIWLIMINDTN